MKSNRVLSYFSKGLYIFSIVFLFTGLLLSAVSLPAQAQEEKPAPGPTPQGDPSCPDPGGEYEYLGKDDFGSESYQYTDPEGKSIDFVYVKAGTECNAFSADTNNGCYIVSGLGTPTVSVERIGDGPDCKEISHVTYYHKIVEEEGEPLLDVEVKAGNGTCESVSFDVTVTNNGDADAEDVNVDIVALTGNGYITSLSPISQATGLLQAGTFSTFTVTVQTDWSGAVAGDEIEIQAVVSASNVASASNSDIFTYQGDCGEQEPDPLPVKPVLECVDDNGDGTYTAHFGYLNENNFAVEIPVGEGDMGRNTLTGNAISGNPVTTFEPGRVNDAFQIVFDGNNLVWTLRYKDSGNRTSTASSSSTLCQEPPQPEFSYSLEGTGGTECLYEAGTYCVTFLVSIENLPQGAVALLETQGSGSGTGEIIVQENAEILLRAGESTEFNQDGTYKVTVCSAWDGLEDPKVDAELLFEAFLSLKQGPDQEALDQAQAVLSHDPEGKCVLPEEELLLLDPFCYATTDGYKAAWQVINPTDFDINFAWQLNGGEMNAGAVPANELFWIGNFDLDVTNTVSVFWGSEGFEQLSDLISSEVCKAPTPPPPADPPTSVQTPVPVTAVEVPSPVVEAAVLIPVTGVDLDSLDLGFFKQLFVYLGFAMLGAALVLSSLKK